MPVTGSTQLTNEIKPLYDKNYYMQGQNQVYFDQFANLRMKEGGEGGLSYNWPIIESGQPTPTALDEYEEVATQQLRANEISVTLAEYGSAIEVTKFSVATSYADVCEQAANVNGYQMAESFDQIARAVMGQGGRQFFQNSRTARSAFSGINTAADRTTTAFIELLMMLGRGIKMPLYEDNNLCTALHPFPFYDLLQATDVRNMAVYGPASEILFNGEMGYWGGLRIIVSANAKAFWGVGAAHPSGTLSTTLAAACVPGDTNLKSTSVTNAAVGQWMSIQDGAESGNTWYDTNELFRVTTVGTAGAGGTGLDGFCLDPGPGDGGGLRYAHASGTTFTNAQSVYPICVFGPNSITKAASSYTGPYGETIVSGPIDRLGRFLTFGWYAIVGYARTRSGWLMRGEVGSSQS